jgi:hypothetical protein
LRLRALQELSNAHNPVFQRSQVRQP